MTETKKKPFLVLGGGCAGLTAAWALAEKGLPVVLIEKQPHLGGLAGGSWFNGNVYEYGPHFFHTSDPTILKMVKNLMGPDLIPYTRTIRIKFLGRYFQFPLSIKDVLLKLSPLTVVHAGFSFVFYFVRGLFWKPKNETSETVLKQFYGDVLYRIFFKDYIYRVWGITPSQMSPSFARQRIPRFHLFEGISKLFKKWFARSGKTKVKGFVEKVEGNLYTTKSGFTLIVRRMREKLESLGVKIQTDSAVVKIHRDKNIIKGVTLSSQGSEETIECSGIINTLPLNESMQMVTPALDHQTVQSAQELRFRSTIFVGLHITRSPVLPASFMYFREHTFNRVSDLSQFHFKITPEGSTLLVAEVNCSTTDSHWTDDHSVREGVIQDLVREKIIERSEVLDTHIFRSEHAYPIYSLHYEKHLENLMKAVSEFKNFETAGRQGQFQYINTHIAMKMGLEAAQTLSQKSHTETTEELAPLA